MPLTAILLMLLGFKPNLIDESHNEVLGESIPDIVNIEKTKTILFIPASSCAVVDAGLSLKQKFDYCSKSQRRGWIKL